LEEHKVIIESELLSRNQQPATSSYLENLSPVEVAVSFSVAVIGKIKQEDNEEELTDPPTNQIHSGKQRCNCRSSIASKKRCFQGTTGHFSNNQPHTSSTFDPALLDLPPVIALMNPPKDFSGI
jgi:phosphoribosyl-dephospho-CoA transferase